MSIATEITRLQGAKADLKTSIEAKGVTVPSATLISGYAALVDQISCGGGLPDSDGIVGLVIANDDMTDSAESITLTYTPTCVLKYSPANPVSNRSSLKVSKTVTYPSVVWSCDSPSITISGNTATIQLGTNADVEFTATWTDYKGDTQTTSKTIHMMHLGYAMVTAQSTYIQTGYVVVANPPGTSTFYGPGGSSLSAVEYYGSNYVIARCSVGGTYTYPPTWGQGTLTFLSNNGTSAASFNSVADAKAAIDSM